MVESFFDAGKYLDNEISKLGLKVDRLTTNYEYGGLANAEITLVGNSVSSLMELGKAVSEYKSPDAPSLDKFRHTTETEKILYQGYKKG